MIKISIFQSLGMYTGYTINGHAGYDDYGRDIVCAAVSILAINTANSLEKLTDSKIEVKEKKKGGMLSLKLISEPSFESEILLKSLVLGLTEISREYSSEYIQIIFKEV